MKRLNFPQISKEIQQSVFGAWGGSSSDTRDYDYYGGELNEVVVGGGGSSGGSSGSNGGFYWGSGGADYGGGNSNYGGGNGYYGGGNSDYGGGNSDYGGGDSDYYSYGSQFGENFIPEDSLVNVAEGDATSEEFWDVNNKLRGAVNATGLAAGFTGTSIDAIAALTKELGFTAKSFAKVGTGIGVAGVAIGGVETVIAIKEVVTGEDPWTDTDTLNAIATVLGAAALVPGPHSLVLGGLSIMVGLVGTAYSNN